MIKIENISSNLHLIKKGSIVIPTQFYHNGLPQYQETLYKSIKLSLSYSDLENSKLSIVEIIDRVKQLPRGYWISFISAISAGISIKGLNDHKIQISFAHNFSVGPYQDKIINKVENEGYFLFIPITLASLLKLALAYAPVEELNHNDESIIFFSTTTYLALNDHVNNSTKKLINVDSESAILKFFFQNLGFSAGKNIFELSLRTWNLLFIYPHFTGSSVIPSDAFVKKNGIDIELFLALAQFVFSHNLHIDFSSSDSIRNHLHIFKDKLFEYTKITDSELSSFFDRQLLNEENITQIKNEDPEDETYFFNFKEIQQHPLIELSDKIYLPLFYPFFVNRVTDFIYWEVFDYLKSKSTSENRKFSTEFGYNLEDYIQDVFKSAFIEHKLLAKRIWIEPKINEGDPSADIVIVYPNATVFIEIKASRIKYDKTIVKGEIESIEDDIRQMLYEPVEQLSKAIEFYKGNNLSSIGLPWNGEIIYPIIITYGTLPNVEIIGPLIKRKVQEKEIIQDDYLDRLVNLDVEEAMSLCSLIKNNIPIIDVINKKNSDENKNIPFMNFVLTEYKDIGEPRHIFMDDWMLFAKTIKSRLFETK